MNEAGPAHIIGAVAPAPPAPLGRSGVSSKPPALGLAHCLDTHAALACEPRDRHGRHTLFRTMVQTLCRRGEQLEEDHGEHPGQTGDGLPDGNAGTHLPLRAQGGKTSCAAKAMQLRIIGSSPRSVQRICCVSLAAWARTDRIKGFSREGMPSSRVQAVASGDRR